LSILVLKVLIRTSLLSKRIGRRLNPNNIPPKTKVSKLLSDMLRVYPYYLWDIQKIMSEVAANSREGLTSLISFSKLM